MKRKIACIPRRHSWCWCWGCKYIVGEILTDVWEKPVRKLWGGRFEGKTDELIERLNNSLVFDGRLWRHDIAGSIAHAEMLGATGIIAEEEAARLVDGLNALK